jgi:hypothetical protein
MKIYNSITIDISSGEVLYEDSFEYGGEIAECKGGSSTTQVEDPEAARRMAAVAEREIAMAEEFQTFWRDFYKPYEIEQIATETNLLPFQEELQTQALKSQISLIPTETAATRSQLELIPTLSAAQQQLTPKLVEEALTPINKEERMGAAAADVATEFGKSREATTREAGRLGFGSERLLGTLSQSRSAEALSSALAQTQAKRTAEQEQFEKVSKAAQTVGLNLANIKTQ